MRQAFSPRQAPSRHRFSLFCQKNVMEGFETATKQPPSNLVTDCGQLPCSRSILEKSRPLRPSNSVFPCRPLDRRIPAKYWRSLTATSLQQHQPPAASTADRASTDPTATYAHLRRRASAETTTSRVSWGRSGVRGPGRPHLRLAAWVQVMLVTQGPSGDNDSSGCSNETLFSGGFVYLFWHGSACKQSRSLERFFSGRAGCVLGLWGAGGGASAPWRAAEDPTNCSPRVLTTLVTCLMLR